MLWECQESSLCECGYNEWEDYIGFTREYFFHNSVKRPFAELRVGQGTQADTKKTWLRLVEAFTKLSLSRESDRLPAISGLAFCVSQRLEGPYMAGIWRDDLASGLLWNKYPYQHSRRVPYRKNDCVPTWSWASVELLSSRSAGLNIFRDDLLADSNFHLISSTSCWRKNTTFSSLRDASLCITGSVISCNLIHRHQPESDIDPNHLLEFQDGEEYVYVDITCDQETTDQTGGCTQVECLLIARTSTERHILFSVTESGPCIVQFALVLQKLDTGAYECIGISEIDSRKGWFAKARLEGFEIV